MISIRFRILAIVIAVFIFASIASQTVFIAPEKAAEKTAEKSSETRSTSSITTSAELGQRIEELVKQGDFSSARWGISVVSLSDGSTLYERNSEHLFTPASNMKIYTTGVALELLGQDYRWRTSVYANAEPQSGVIQGDLILYGRGAPDLVSKNKAANTASLEKLAEDLYARGVRTIRGNVIGDESYFRGNALGDGWQWTDIQWYFGAEASALSINENEVDVNVLPSNKSGTPPDVRVTDVNGFVTVQNRMAVNNDASRPTIGLYRGLSNNNVEVWGELTPGYKGFGARLSVHNPALWAATLFREALRTRGITVDGQPQSRTSRVPPSQRFDPSRAVELASVTSKPLADIVRETNKESNNLYAELILRTLGRERRAMLDVGDPPGRELGDEESGVALIRLWLSRAGVPTARLALHDGSGLSRLNLVTPSSATRLLVTLSKGAAADAFRASLPIAGQDGTLGGRLSGVNKRVQAKTGSLTYDNTLSGYVTTENGQSFAFSVLCNDQTGRGNSIRLIDQIVSLLAGYPNIPKEKANNTHQ